MRHRLHTIASFQEFADQAEHYVKTAQEFDSDFVLFSELFTTQLMYIPSEEGKLGL